MNFPVSYISLSYRLVYLGESNLSLLKSSNIFSYFGCTHTVLTTNIHRWQSQKKITLKYAMREEAYVNEKSPELVLTVSSCSPLPMVPTTALRLFLSYVSPCKRIFASPEELLKSTLSDSG